MATVMSTISADDIKERIISILEKNHTGVTINELAEQIGVHRQTVSKYTLELKGAKLICKRKVGPAVLHYLEENGSE